MQLYVETIIKSGSWMRESFPLKHRFTAMCIDQSIRSSSAKHTYTSTFDLFISNEYKTAATIGIDLPSFLPPSISNLRPPLKTMQLTADAVNVKAKLTSNNCARCRHGIIKEGIPEIRLLFSLAKRKNWWTQTVAAAAAAAAGDSMAPSSREIDYAGSTGE